MMLCDELKYERLGDAFNDYPDSTLVIRKQYVDAAIVELKADNERLIQDLYKTDHHDIQYLCKMYGCDNIESFHGEIKNLQTKLIATECALWLARAAMCRTYDIRAYFIENPDSKRRFTDFFVLMQKAAATAAIKAEEYK